MKMQIALMHVPLIFVYKSKLTSPILLRCLIVLGLERCSDKCSSVRLLYVARGLGIGGEVATWLVPFMYEITVTYPAEEACMMGPS